MTEKRFQIGGGWLPGRLFDKAVSAAGVPIHQDEYVLSIGREWERESTTNYHSCITRQNLDSHL
jgi:hypothetical protein